MDAFDFECAENGGVRVYAGEGFGCGRRGYRRFVRLSGLAAQSPGGDFRVDDAVAERGSDGGGQGIRERGAVRAGSVLLDRLCATAAGGAAKEFADGAVEDPHQRGRDQSSGLPWNCMSSGKKNWGTNRRPI